MPEQKDSEFTWKGFQEANDNELVNNLANFIHRVLVLTHKYYDGVVPEFDPDCSLNSASGSDMPSFHDSELLDLHDMLDAMAHDILAFDFRSALTRLMGISSAGNQLLQFNEPWSQIKEDPDLVKVVMNLGMQYVTALSVAMYPFLPFTATRLRKLLNLPALEHHGEWVELMMHLAEDEVLIPTGHRIQPGEHLFTRLDPADIEKQMAKLKKPEEASAQNVSSSQMDIQLKPEIQYDDFAKLDIRTATILSAARVEKADKLLKLELDLGVETRTVVSGIALHYKPEEIIGRQVVLLANLAPRKIRGVESKGMILMAEDSAGRLCFVSPDAGWENGMGIS
jgi:methionyl-tRNA synthetase